MRVKSSQSSVDFEKLMERFQSQDDQEDQGPVDMSRFMDDDDDDDAPQREATFSAEGFLNALTGLHTTDDATSTTMKSNVLNALTGLHTTDDATSTTNEEQRVKPTLDHLFDRIKEEEDDRIVVPLSDDIIPTGVTPASSKGATKGKSSHTSVAAQPASSGKQNFVKKEVVAAPTEIVAKSETAKVEPDASLFSEVSIKKEEASDDTVIPAEAAVYWFDAKEQDHHHSVDPGSIFLFGKYVVGVGSNKSFESCCIRVVNVERTVMFLPKAGVQEVDVIHEVASLCKKLQIPSFRFKVVERHYAFEEPNIPRDCKKWVKLRYPARHGPFPTNVNWINVEAVVGADRSLLEWFILKRCLRGPSYLRIGEWMPVPEGQRVTHCKHEFRVLNPKMVTPIDGGVPPPLVAVSIQLQTQLDASESHNEVHAVSLVVCKTIAADGSAKTAPISQQMIGVRPFNPQSPLPIDVEKFCAGRGLSSVRRFANEGQLLQWVATMLKDIDPDLLVGHNFMAFTLDVLLHRFQAHRVNNWSSIGRLDLRQFPKLQSGAGGTGESTYQEREIVMGRLVVDTYLLSREYYKSNNYKLIALAQQLSLHGIFGPVAENFEDSVVPMDARNMTQNAFLFDVLARSLNHAVLALALANQLDVVPLTKRLCSLAGNLWIFFLPSLAGSRAERIEYLLLHAFHQLKFVTPDKKSFFFCRSLAGSRAERIEYLLLHAFHQLKFVTPDKKSFEAIEKAKRSEMEEDGGDGAAATMGGTSRRAKAKYKGGMVLEPKSGLYTDYILMLDFNSLYPSLIQEFNICFTTVRRAGGCEVFKEDEDPTAPSGVPPPERLICKNCSALGLPSPCIHRCVLPKVIKSLVDSRREVKRLMKSERDPANLAQLEIRQKALKLTANSMYGCLGFAYSRFYAQPLAELVTRQGRHALMKTVDEVPLVHPSLRVLYGDTDSVMIQTGVRDDLRLVRDMATDIKAKINKSYRCLEIDIDGIFRSILLHKKKKYAAVHVVDWAGEGKILKKEVKGLDMVRRDWCRLSQRSCDELLNRILETTDQAVDVCDFIAQYMGTVAQRVREGATYPLEDYIIAKGLTKEPELYKGTTFPHATVAQRMRDRKEQVRVGDLIPYVICRVDDEATNASISSKAFHPSEVQRDGRMLDTEWYLTSQLYPPVMRICEHIQGFTAAQLAEAMGIHVHIEDEGRYQYDQGSRDTDASKDIEQLKGMFKSDDLDECFPDAVKLEVQCEKCQRMTIIQPHARVRQLFESTGVPSAPFELYVCTTCRAPQRVVYVTNRLQLAIRNSIAQFYRHGGDSAAVRKLRMQMTYFRALFDAPHMPGCSRKIVHMHNTLAKRCLTVNGKEVTKAYVPERDDGDEGDVVDPAFVLIQATYERVDHMLLDVGGLLQGLPSHQRTTNRPATQQH
ncbi:DNA polymerase alpha catalytic partial, putative [Bodo saltans]|uniref:DNA polymerase n=1 Tax=Bodo saltans TaxID=75058 RepID=A0A0S4IUC6_BODSA|nr:DNA polymerase alpha catalytic partial, putative [Bodo saltans]